jgi:hypothetical protein
LGAELLKHAFAIDVLACPRGGRMRVLSAPPAPAAPRAEDALADSYAEIN